MTVSGLVTSRGIEASGGRPGFLHHPIKRVLLSALVVWVLLLCHGALSLAYHSSCDTCGWTATAQAPGHHLGLEGGNGPAGGSLSPEHVTAVLAVFGAALLALLVGRFWKTRGFAAAGFLDRYRLPALPYAPRRPTPPYLQIFRL